LNFNKLTIIIFSNNHNHKINYGCRVLLGEMTPTMNLYKVEFDDKGVTSTEKLNLPQCGTVCLDDKEGKRVIKWITISAENEQESVYIATRVVRDFFQFTKTN
jgi:hypothetical protein